MTVQIDSKAVVVRKKGRSRKSPALKTAVIIKRSQGRDKTSISKELGIARNTVSRILEESDVDLHITAGQQASLGLIPAAIRVAEHRLALNSENMAVKVLENTIWPLKDRVGKSAGDPSLVLAIQNLMGNVNVQNSAPVQAISDAKKSEEKTSAPIDIQSSASPAPSEDTKQ